MQAVIQVFNELKTATNKSICKSRAEKPKNFLAFTNTLKLLRGDFIAKLYTKLKPKFMNLQEMELSQLVMLWQASGGNPQLKLLIEAELQKRIQQNTNFSREYFFDICKIKNHAITVSFIPTSKAYQLYGPNLTIDILLTEEEMQEMIKNYSAKPSVNTTGIIKAKILVNNNLSQEQIENAKNIGFHTSEIFETLHI